MNNTLRNGLRVLEHLAGTTESFAVSGLAEALDLPKSHVHRLLQGLVEDGWAVQDGDRRYRIGLKPLELSSALLTHLPLRRAALPALRRLCAQTGYDVVLAHLHDGAALVIAEEYVLDRQHDPGSAVGRRLNLHASACGKLLAGYLPEEQQLALLAKAPFPALTPATATTADAVRGQWTRARLEHVAVNREENGAGVCSIAVAVRDREQRVLAGLGLALPAARWSDEHGRELATLLHAAADTIRIPSQSQSTASGDQP